PLDTLHPLSVVNVDHGGSGNQLFTPTSAEAPISGLVDGNTYYIDFIHADNFAPRSTPGGSDLTGLGTSVGTHRLSIDGIALQSAGSGGQQLVINLTSAGAG